MRCRSSVVPRTRALGLALLGLAALAGACKDRTPNTPITLIQTPFDEGGRVTIVFTLRNPDTTNVDVEVQWATTDGSFVAASPTPDSPPTTGLTASPGGTVHRFIWDAMTDLGPGQHSVRVRVSPRIDGSVGTPATTLLFTVNNTGVIEWAATLSHAREQAALALAAGDGAEIAGVALGAEADRVLPGDAAVLPGGALLTPRRAAGCATLLVSEAGHDEPRPHVFGGRDVHGNALASVEAYDAGADAWVASPPLASPRAEAIAVPLRDGARVVLVGGRDDSGLVANLEIWDARGGSVSIPAPEGGRTGHAAVGLPDGRVLVLGGRTAAGVTASAWVIDPDASPATVTAAPALDQPREGHGAAVVGDRIVVFGGADASGDPLASIVWAPLDLSAAFTPLRDAAGDPIELSVARRDAGSVTIGTSELWIAGGRGARGPLDLVERLQPELGVIRTLSTPLLSARGGLAGLVLGNGAVLFAGGGSAELEFARPRLPLTAGPQTVLPEIAPPDARAQHGACLLTGGTVLIAGGTDGVVDGGALRVLAGAQRFDPAAAAMQRVTPTAGALQQPRRLHTLSPLPDGGALVAGGLDATEQPLASLERYRPVEDDFVLLAATLPEPVSRHRAVALLDGRVLITGGRTASGTTATAWIFDPNTESVTATAAMGRPREGHLLLRLADGRVLAAGGWDTAAGAAADDAELWDPATGSWSAAGGDLGGGRFEIAAAVLSTGEVLLAGGRSAPGAAPVDTVAVFSPATGSLTVKPTGLATARARAAAVPDASGAALVLGGETGPPLTPGEPAAAVTASVERYDPSGDGASTVPADPDLPAPCAAAAVLPLPDGRWLLVGGTGPVGVVRAAAEQVVP